MSAGPFVVIHREKFPAHGDSDASHGRVLYREAFATLEEVRGAVTRLGLEPALSGTDDEYAAAARAYNDEISVNGVGSLSLPNGDVIEVEATEWTALVDAIEPGEGIPARRTAGARWPTPEEKRAIIAAWNAEHGIDRERHA